MEARSEETYPEGTFEALLVIAVDWCQYLEELQDALLIVEVGYLLKRLLNQFTQSFSLGREEGGGSERRDLTGNVQAVSRKICSQLKKIEKV